MPKNILVGVWNLVSYIVTNEKGELINEPLGQDPKGQLIYTENGYMAVNCMSSSRPHFGNGYSFQAHTKEKVQAFNSYFGYNGTYELQENRVIHHVTVSSFPNWSGTNQIREMKLDGDQLTLSMGPKLVKGESRTWTLVWRRI